MNDHGTGRAATATALRCGRAARITVCGHNTATGGDDTDRAYEHDTAACLSTADRKIKCSQIVTVTCAAAAAHDHQVRG